MAVAVDTSTPTTTARRLDVQGLRAIAVLLVVAYHAGLPLPGGFVGVDVFFVISGYVITGLIMRKPTFNWTSFAARRVKRLLPALALVVVVVIIAAFLLQSPLGPQQVTGKTGAGAMLGVANMVILVTTRSYFDASAVTNPLLHTWSLSVEEQFYLIFPFILVFARKRRIVVITLSVLTVVSFVVCMALSYGYSPVSIRAIDEALQLSAFYLSSSRAWEFAAGALIAVIVYKLPASWSKAAAYAGVATLAAAALLIQGAESYPGIAALLPVFGTVLLIMAGGSGHNPISKLLSTRPMVSIGDMSYSIYLWHWPIIVFATLLWPSTYTAFIAAVVSFVPAWAAYRWFEQPIRFMEAPKWRILGIGVTASLVIAALGLSLTAFGVRAVANGQQFAAEQKTLTPGRATSCMLDFKTYQPADLKKCMFTTPKAKGWIMLAGDSHADSFSGAVIPAGHKLGYNVLALTGAGCEFSRTPPAQRLVPNCAQMQNDLLDLAVGKDRPALVVIAHWAAKKTDWPKDLEPTLQELERAKVPVLNLTDVPNFAKAGGRGFSACTGGAVNFSCSKPIEAIRAVKDMGARDRELALGSRYSNVSVFDPWPTFCNATECSAEVNGRLAYWDFHHLNGIGSAALTEPIRAAMVKSLQA